MVDFAPLFQELQKQGYSPAGAAGIVGNFGQESGGNPAVIGDQGTSGGLGQWHAERFQNLKNFAAQSGRDWRDPAAQLKFADHEIRNTPGLFNSLNRASNPSAAAVIFQNQFERPAPATANTANREAIANQVFQNQGQGPTRANAQSQFGAVGLPAPNGSPTPQAATVTAPSPQPASPGQDLANALGGLATGFVAPAPAATQAPQPHQSVPSAFPSAPDPMALAQSLLAGTHGNLVLGQ